ncbi:hemerythrin domain-containing protein [Ramlibacter sp. PS4R-6]|uniref:hemerythrin domain-containing protein n=1 Tax=Ramlibacter sp. PS4R-6 TaxID=3133438 RepID=UPI00309AFF44
MEFADKDACELLDADHIAVKHLFVEYARLAVAMPDESAGERTQLAMRICDELTVHAQIEEDIFYPALREAAPETRAQLDEARQEHQEAKQMIASIRALGSAGPQMDELVSQLACAIEHHVKEERDELFPKAKARMDLGEVGDRLRERQQALQAATA